MNIVIMGAGTVGTSIAELLCGSQQNVCVVDLDPAALAQVEERLDVRTLPGSACDAATLFQAGVLTCDLCLAVTSHDEVNLIGASLAKAMGARRAVARVFNRTFLDASTFDYQRHFQIDRLLSLEHLTAIELAKSIRLPGLFAVEDFARGAIEVQELYVEEDAKAAGVSMMDLSLPSGVRVGLISNSNHTVVAGGLSVAEPGDRVTLIGESDKLERVGRLFGTNRALRTNVIIAGGGEIGYNLALMLQPRRCHLMIMEADADRAEYLAGKLQNTTVLHADATQRVEMEEARVGKSDVFVAATGHDEDNIVCGVEARELGSKRILSIVRRPDYANVLEKLGIDVAVSPREAMARQILGMVETGPLVARTQIASGEAEVWEVEILPDAPITAGPLKSLDLQEVLIAAIETENFVRVPNADDLLVPNDTAIVLVHRHSMERARALFALDP